MNAGIYKVYATNHKEGNKMADTTTKGKIRHEQTTEEVVLLRTESSFESFKSEFEEIQNLLKEKMVSSIKNWRESWKNSGNLRMSKSIECKYKQKLDKVYSCFEFKLLSINSFAFGNEEKGNYRICQYGIKDYFRNCIWIHTHELKELILDYMFDDEIVQLSKKYLEMVQQYYRTATNRDYYGS